MCAAAVMTGGGSRWSQFTIGRDAGKAASKYCLICKKLQGAMLEYIADEHKVVCRREFKALWRSSLEVQTGRGQPPHTYKQGHPLIR